MTTEERESRMRELARLLFKVEQVHLPPHGGRVAAGERKGSDAKGSRGLA
jgi:hypothetical protein